MRILAGVAGVVCLFVVLLDAFQTIILPRRASGRFRLTRLFYIASWRPWAFFTRRLRNPRHREGVQFLRAALAHPASGGVGRRDGSWFWSDLLRSRQSFY